MIKHFSYMLPLVILSCTSKAIAQTQLSTEKNGLTIGGAARINYSYKEYDEQSKSTLGNLDFELFRLNVTNEIGDFKLFAQYRWYNDFSFPDYAYLSYSLTDNSELQFGLNKVPFGILPYSSFGYWQSILYHIGLEDDNDVGLKYSYADQQWEIDLGFYKNAELSSDNHARYSFDVISDAEQNEFNQELNQFNIRVERKVGDTNLGLSMQYGSLYNELTTNKGEHSAVALHVATSYENWNFQVELGNYQYQPENPQGKGSDRVLFGAFENAFYIASEADFYLLNVSREIVEPPKLIGKMSCYNNFGVVIPKRRSENVGNKTIQNTLGCDVSSGSITSYIELISGQNASFVNGPGVGLVDDASWSHRININVGYYF